MAERAVGNQAGISRRRRVTGIVSAGVAVGTAAALCAPIGVGFASAADCSAKGAVVIVAGTNDPDSLVMKGVADKYAADGYDVEYANYPTTLWPAGSVGYNDDVRRGKGATAKAINDYRTSGGAGCANAPVTIVGYSQGARVAGDVLSDIGNHRAVDVNNTPDDTSDDVVIDDSNVTGELYSDPRQAGSVVGRGIELALIGVIPGLTMTGPRKGGFGTLAGGVVSVCDRGDPICDLPDPVRDPIGALDGLLGYFTKHGVYPSGFLGATPANWANGNCHDAGSGGTVCIREDESAFIGLVKQFAAQLGIPAVTVNGIPDVVAWRPRVPGEILPNLTIGNLQPLIRLVQDRLPELPNLTYHAGGYLPDAFVFQTIAEGILQLNTTKLTSGASALARSLASIVLIPVNGTLYWSKRLVGVGPGPYYLTPTVYTAPSSSTLAVASTPETSTSGSARLRRTLARAFTALSSEAAADDTPAIDARKPATRDTDPPSGNTPGWQPTVTTPAPDPAPSTDSAPTTPSPRKRTWQSPFSQPWNRGDRDSDRSADSTPKWRSPFGLRGGKRTPQSGPNTGTENGGTTADGAGGGKSGDDAGSTENGTPDAGSTGTDGGGDE